MFANFCHGMVSFLPPYKGSLTSGMHLHLRRKHFGHLAQTPSSVLLQGRVLSLVPIRCGYFCAFCFAFVVADPEETPGSITVPQHCPSCNCVVVYEVEGRVFFFFFFSDKTTFQSYSWFFTDFGGGNVFWNHELQNVPFVLCVGGR